MWKPASHASVKRRGRIVIMATMLVAIIALIIVALPYAYARSYRDRVLPGVHLGSLDVGGLKRQSLENILHAFADALSIKGVPLLVERAPGKVKVVYLGTLVATSVPDQSHELVDLDIEETVRSVFSAGRGLRAGEHALAMTHALVFGRRVEPVWVIDRVRLREALSLNLQEFQNPGADARIVVVADGTLTVERERIGTSFDYADIERRLDAVLADFTLQPIEVRLQTFTPAVSAADVLSKFDAVARVSATGTIAFLFDDSESKELKKWELTSAELVRMLTVTRDQNGALIVGVDAAAGRKFFERIAAEVNILSQDAKFEITVPDSGASGTPRVKEFQPSRAGRALNIDIMVLKLEELVAGREQGVAPVSSVALVIETSEPQVKTGEANTLGIQELLGVGTSNFKGSPANRKKNIKNGVEKLNGTLIAPGEEFSLLAHLRPFSKEGGYLPELVIKGDKIVPEIGGGLCQIGTTMFRATMKAGMPVTNRRNHSIVVRYYNDPQNNAPGTDATIYDPSPDFKFMNDTGRYMLLTTEMDMEKSELRFKLWGTSDNRKGDYTAPVVHKWIGVGPDKIIETDTMKPEDKKCQEAHPGAVTSFTYFVLKPDGTRIETVYDSYYRPLPKICLVGKTAEAPAIVAGEMLTNDEVINVAPE